MTEKEFYRAHKVIFAAVAATTAFAAGALHLSEEPTKERFTEAAAPAEAPDLGAYKVEPAEPEAEIAPPTSKTPDEQLNAQSEIMDKILKQCKGEYSRYTVELNDGTTVNRYSCAP